MRFGVLVPDEYSGALVSGVGEQMGVELIWIIVDKAAVSSQLDRLIHREHVDGIIARSPYGNLIEEELEVPVATMHISRQDLIQTVQRVTPGKKVAFLYPEADAEKFAYNQEELLSLPDHPIQALKIQDDCDNYTVEDPRYWAEEGAFEKFRSCQAIASGTPMLLKAARDYGMETVTIRIDPFELRCAVRNLISAVNSRARDIRNNRLLEAVLNTTNSGFMILENGTVTIANNNICKMSGVPMDRLHGRQETELSELNAFFKKAMQVRRKEIITYNDVPYSVFRRPLELDPSLVQKGPIELISVIDVPKLYKTESQIRKSIDSNGFTAKWHFEDMIAEDMATRMLVRTARQFSNASSNVLILGESGTGKDVLAQCIHNASPYARGPFVALNCASLPENLLESELFGYEEGAFTGARKGGKPGIFEISYGGTLFLDEIGEMPLSLQAKLLRVIQEKAIVRVGGRKVIPIRNRLIFATNRNLDEMVAEKQFRQDLLYRINVLELTIPPLRERPEDVKALFRYFLEKYQGSQKKIEKGAVEYLAELSRGYAWPGNVRELQNIVERLLVMQSSGSPGEDRDQMVRRSLGLLRESRPAPQEMSALPPDGMVLRRGTLKEMEDQLYRDSYDRCGGNMRRMAEELDIGYNTVRRWIQRET